MLPLSPRPMIRVPIVQRIVGLHLWKGALQHLAKIIEVKIHEHKLSVDPDNTRDMIDLYLTEIESTTDVNSSFYKERGHYAMLNNFVDLFVAGMETTSSSIIWTFLLLLHHPEIKENIKKEIDAVTYNLYFI